jgi:serine/threonine-protein kinase
MAVLVPGTLVTPNLELVRLLGAGSIGSVWVANHHTLKIEVAVKLLERGAGQADPKTVARFTRQGAAAKIRSPHVVRVFDSGVSDTGVPYLVMELLQGTTLERRLQRQRRLTPNEARLVVVQVAQALRRAHDQGIVHRDVRPQNLFLVDSDYELFVKVLDFGLAKYVARPSLISAGGGSYGAVEYMSPEMLLDVRQVDSRADVWSLAVVGYRALTGELPFSHVNLVALTNAIRDGKFEPARRHLPALPLAVDAVFARAFHPEVDERFPSAVELARAFADALEQPVVDDELGATGDAGDPLAVGDDASEGIPTLPRAVTGPAPAVAEAPAAAAPAPAAAAPDEPAPERRVHPAVFMVLGLVVGGLVVYALISAGVLRP